MIKQIYPFYTHPVFSPKKLSALVLGLAAFMTLSINPAEARGACRDYSKTTLLNGRLEVGFAQACHRHGNRWEIVSLSAGPIELRTMVMEMVHRDLYVIDPYYALYDGGYPVVYHRHVSPPPARVVYHTLPPRVVYVQPRPVIYKTAPPRHVVHHHHHSHKRKHDARHTHRHRNHRDHQSRRR